MSNLAKSLVRDMAQKLLGIVFAWIGVHVIAVPEDVKNAVTNWVVLSVTAVLMFVWTALVRWLESHHGSSQFDTWCRALARILMLGITSTPMYVNPVPPAAPVPLQPAPTAPLQFAPTPTVGPDGTPLQTRTDQAD